jgi:hypothetical protein
MEPSFKAGDRVVVRTPDRRDYRGIVLGLRQEDNGRVVVVLRLDTGWEVTYPVGMVYVEDG